MTGKPKPIDLADKQIEMLAGYGCTLEEIAAVAGCSARTLARRHADAIDRGRLLGKASLRRRMWDTAINDGNVTMMIWLSKTMLGMHEATPAAAPELPASITIELADAQSVEAPDTTRRAG